MQFLKNNLIPSKMIYFECSKGNSHQGEKLNYVCINKKCKDNGLICSICRTEHQKHDEEVIPLKMILDRLKTSNAQQKESESNQGSLQNYLQKLENIKSLILFQLKNKVQKIAQSFMKFEQQILKDFDDIKVKLLQQIQVNLNMDFIIKQALSNKIKNQKQFTDNIKTIANMIQAKDKKKQFTINNDLQKFVSSYQKNYQSISSKLSQIQEDVNHILSKKTEIKIQQIKKKNKKIIQNDSVFGGLFAEDSSDNQEVVQKPILLTNNVKYTFSTLLKGNSILIEKNGLQAKQTASGSLSRFVMVNQGVGLKQQKITFKITKLVNWVGFGIGIRHILAKCNYNFNYSNSGHGSYLLSTNGYTWSHSQTEDNISAKGFLIKQEEIIDVFLTQKQLKFKKQIDGSQLKIKISIKPEEWPGVCFCANLCSAEDKIEIIN